MNQRTEHHGYVNLKLAALGQPPSVATVETEFMALAAPLVRNYFEKDELFGWPQCAADQRIQTFLDSYLSDVCPEGVPRLPKRSLVLDRPGLARTLALPPRADSFASPYLTSYRIAQGVLHNPKNDRRTTQGVFHVAEGGLPIALDKQAVPKRTFALLLAAALQPPPDVLALPYTSDQDEIAHAFVSLLMRPTVCPATDREPRKSMEVRFFAPGTLVSNLDFVETIFGNAGDPFLAENDAALDSAGWTGHTGCVILAPHLVGLKKKDLGLPHFDQASARQRRDGMCYRDGDELYNGGSAFKITCRDARGVIVTLIADNYYGYCKKEIKTQISYAANLFGACEEEHSGGVIAHPSYVLGNNFNEAQSLDLKPTTFYQMLHILGPRALPRPGGYALDATYPELVYVPENAAFAVRDASVRWPHGSGEHRLTLRPSQIYMLPSGYTVKLEKHPKANTWRLVGSRAESVLCHKPCTVSGGGKSEISKSLRPMIHLASVFVRDFQQDFARVAEIVKMDFSKCYKQPTSEQRASRPLLSAERSLGSVIKLLTPSDDYTDEHNAWLRALPQTIRELVCIVKRHYRPDWGEDFQSHFTVDSLNGFAGHELKFENQPLQTSQLRVGFEPETNMWRMHKLRPDFYPAQKVQVEDDITASVTVARERVRALSPEYRNRSVKIVENCEEYLFQRPDDAVHRGFDAQAEADMATPGTFITNFEPLSVTQASELVDQVAELDRFTAPMKELLIGFVAAPRSAFVVSSAHTRIVAGKPSKNPRYLQRRPDRVEHREAYIAEVAARLDREIPSTERTLAVVGAVLGGRRANRGQAEIGLPPLAVFNPIHYQELPELFMDFLSSLTGKSPSTTGFGSEGALTKGPFNALWPVVDMNNALVSAILTGYDGFTTAAGYLGPRYRVDHDVSMVVPEVWCRMSVREREASYLIERGYLEKVEDFELNGRKVLASRLGYRITGRFVDHFLARIFQSPNAVFTPDMLRPEQQDLESFAAGVDAIVETQTQVARGYFEDGSIEGACPPLRALLHIMAHGQYEGLGIADPAIRALFTREALLQSEWYRERLLTKQARDIALWTRHAEALQRATSLAHHWPKDLSARREAVARELARVSSAQYLEELVGTIGADPFHGQRSEGAA
ncbi:MAG TPA: hypothetical protein VFK05_15325 [Polyangiaceae bacterium]|nr:hypothetical protein [Polyangiaceae bacterium]